eukprot:gene2178-2681_t
MSKKNAGGDHHGKKEKKKSKLSHQQALSLGSQAKGIHGSSTSGITQPSSLPPALTLPVDQILPFAPECLLFMQLLEFEKKLDSSITKRLVDNQEAQRTRTPKTFRALRLSIYNTYANQQGSYHVDNKSLASVCEKASWTLRIEGRLLDDTPLSFPGGMAASVQGGKLSANTHHHHHHHHQQQRVPKRKFSSFFKKIFIQIGHRDSCEWDKSQSFSETDGFEIKRTGSQEVDIKILMYLDHTPQKSKVLGPLSQLLNIHTDTKPKITLAFWHYIKTNKLLDVDCKKINCDESLKNIFGLDVIQFNQIPQLLREHLGPPDPLEFNYTLRLSGDPRDYEQAYDIQVEVDDPIYNMQAPLPKKEIQALDEEIHQIIRDINAHKRKREFMEKLSDNPLRFLNELTQSQIKDYQIIKSSTSTGFEEERHSSFYYQPIMEDIVTKYLSKQITPSPTPTTIVNAPPTPSTPSS